MSYKLPKLDHKELIETRDAVHLYSKILGNLRAKFTPREKHYWHISLKMWSQGFTTTPIPTPSGVFEIFLNLLTHKIEIATNNKQFSDINLIGQSQIELFEQIRTTLSSFDINLDINSTDIDNKELSYNKSVAESFFRTYSIMDIVLKKFRSLQKEECSPVQIWPHHMDIAFNWFSGNKIPDKDTEDEEISSEQIGYGFLTGDSYISEPYLYVLPYPEIKNFEDVALLNKGKWHKEHWTGITLKYNDFQRAENPERLLLEFLQDSHNKVRKLMHP